MSSDETAHYQLTPRALSDLDDIWRFSAETWSIEQADRYIDELVRVFELIAAMPKLAHERSEFTPPVRIHVHASYLIIYTIADDHVAILRVVGARQGWVSILKMADL